MTKTFPPPWRQHSPLDGQRPTESDLKAAKTERRMRDDVLPYPTLGDNAGAVRMLIVGINPSPWTIAVNAPFAHPGNRFWPSLAAGQVLPYTVDASTGLSGEDEQLLASKGIGITNLVRRPSSRADELSTDELRSGAADLVERVKIIQPRTVAIVGITAFRTAFRQPKAQIGSQDTEAMAGWPSPSPLWVLPNPSGLNAHETTETLGEKWREVWQFSAS